MLRNDGSVRSTNFPEWGNRHVVRDFGIYKGAVRSVIYSDDENNDSAGQEVVYKVIIIGGDRDGQVFDNARVMRGLGGAFNYQETVLKATEGLSGFDPASPQAAGDPSLRNIPTHNGDVVYLQFLNGDIALPLIVGFAHHKKAPDEATESDGQRDIRMFNGCKTFIDADGVFTFTKDNGAYAAAGLNPDDHTYPLVNQFVPFVGGKEAFTFSVDNQFVVNMALALGPSLVLTGSTTDSLSLTTYLGTSIDITGGTADSVALTTAAGAAFTLDGLGDSLALATTAGAMINIDGISDSVDISTTAGNSISLSTSGVAIAGMAGESLELASGAVTMASSAGASLELDAAGFVKLGNSTGDALAILGELIQQLSVETASGFGAPLTGAPIYAQLLAKIQLITGG